MMKKIFNKKNFLVLTVIANILYITWRMFFTLPTTYGLVSMFFGVALLIVELGGVFELFIHFYTISGSQNTIRPEIDEDLYPHVDVFIATYNEPEELVRKTIVGSKNMYYPDPKKVHIYICDDGRRDTMKNLAEELGVHYVRRDDNKGAKAGNLNNAMRVSNSPLIVTLDADMIPISDFLLSTIPYFLQNEQARKDNKEEEYKKVGFIQTPQCFYNPDLFQFYLHSEGSIPNEQDYFYRNIQTSRNKTNTVIYGGSNTVLSREALNEIGGFFTNSITEDFATGMLIQSKGYVCFAVNEVHASGLSPDDLKSLVKQRARWGRGCIQTGRRVNILGIKGLNLKQKLSYISSITYWYGPIKRLIYIISPIVAAVFGVMVLDCTFLEMLCFWLPTFLLTRFSVQFNSSNIRNSRWTNIYETIMFPALLPAIILEIFGISQNKFSVTKKNKKQVNDKMYRVKYAVPFVLFILFSIVGIAKMLTLSFEYQTSAYLIILFWLCSNMFNFIVSLFFLIGRKQYRSADRFVADLDCHISQQNFKYDSVTFNISETGFAFKLEDYDYLDPNEPFFVEFRYEVYSQVYYVKLKCMVASVMNAKNHLRYSAYFIDLTQSQKDVWNFIVHDREPNYPKMIDNSSGYFEEVHKNIQRRKNINNTVNQKNPMIKLDCDLITLDYRKVKFVEFNYETVRIRFNVGEKTSEVNVNITKDLIIKCVLEQGEYYKVVNLSEIIRNEKTRFILRKFLSDYEKTDVSIIKEKEFDELDIMNYI